MFLPMWLAIFMLSFIGNQILLVLTRRSKVIHAIFAPLQALGSLYHEFSHYVFAKISGLHVELEKVNRKWGYLDYLKEDSVIIRVLLVALAPSFLGTLLLCELGYWVVVNNATLHLGVIVGIWIGMLVIFLAIGSCLKDLQYPYALLSHNPKGWLWECVFLLGTLPLYFELYSILEIRFPLRPPYLSIVTFIVSYGSIRIFKAGLVIIKARIKKQEIKQLNHHAPVQKTPKYLEDKRSVEEKLMENRSLPWYLTSEVLDADLQEERNQKSPQIRNSEFDFLPLHKMLYEYSELICRYQLNLDEESLIELNPQCGISREFKSTLSPDLISQFSPQSLQDAFKKWWKKAMKAKAPTEQKALFIIGVKILAKLLASLMLFKDLEISMASLVALDFSQEDMTRLVDLNSFTWILDHSESVHLTKTHFNTLISLFTTILTKARIGG